MGQVTVQELALECVNANNRYKEMGLTGEASVMLVSKGKAPFPRKGFPRPHLACENPRGERVYYYPALRLLAALAAHNLIQIQLPE